MSLITKVLHYLGENYPDSKAVQIGAMDGISFDDTRGFFDMYKWETILVEPIPEIYEALKVNLKDRVNLHYENSAITEKNGTVTMITVPKEVIEKENLHPGYAGMSAVYPIKNGFGGDYQRDVDVKKDFGVDIEVPSITFDKLLKKYNFNNVDILICDAEGYDWKIFNTIDLNKFPIKFIRLEYINLTEEEKTELQNKLTKYDYEYEISGQDIDIVKKNIFNEMENDNVEVRDSNFTVVSGLWDLNRKGRSFKEHYLPRFREFLKIDQPMILFLPKSLEEEVWKVRNKSNTFVKRFELEDLKNLYLPHWEKTQNIRNSKKWLEITGKNGWLKDSPQATLEYYNPVVQSKMFLLHDASIYNTFNTDYFFWLDAGITNTVPVGHLVENKHLSKLTDYADPFLFLSYPYKAVDEIHGFDYKSMNEFAGTPVKYVCRGGLFGGHKDTISTANSTYYSLLQNTLDRGVMGTEESIFSIMANREPNLYRRFMLDANGLIVKFTEALIKNTVKLESIDTKNLPTSQNIINKSVLQKLKTNLYILTFNFPKQVLHTINSMKEVPEWLEKPNLILLDNSTSKEARKQNKKIAKENNFEYISLKGNKGICGGRQYAAEHFHDSDADFYFFFEDDMTTNSAKEEGNFCRNGFRKFIPNLYEKVHKIMLKEKFDFLKLSFTEVYWDNNIQTSWYNVPQSVRTKVWPHYDRLPITGRDPNAPRTKFDRIDNLEGLSYITGEVFYCNWPMIVSREGNQKMFIDTKWAHPYEQTWMSHIFQETLAGNINPAVLLASPINHDRIEHYKPEQRREN